MKKQAIMAGFGLLLGLVATGCAPLRQDMGFNAGMKDYERMQKGKKISAWRIGWVQGFSFSKTSHDLDASLEKLRKAMEELNRAK